jgi:hypothetical protein
MWLRRKMKLIFFLGQKLATKVQLEMSKYLRTLITKNYTCKDDTIGQSSSGREVGAQIVSRLWFIPMALSPLVM